MDVGYDRARCVEPPGLDARGADGALLHCDEPRRLITTSAVADHVRGMSSGERPSLFVLYLGQNFDLLAAQRLGEGNSADCGVKPMRLIRQAHGLGAMGFVLVHYEGSPSFALDPTLMEAARELRRLGEDFGTYLFHHLVVGPNRVREVAT